MARKGGPNKHQMQGLEFDRYGGEMPAFLKRLTGETPEGRAERRRLDMPDDSDSEPEGAGATIVVLKEGDLTREEVAAIREGKTLKRDHADDAQEAPENEDEDQDDDGTIKFRKPKKSKSGKELGNDSKKITDVKETKRKDVKGVKNSALLSFGDEEEDE